MERRFNIPSDCGDIDENDTTRDNSQDDSDKYDPAEMYNDDDEDGNGGNHEDDENISSGNANDDYDGDADGDDDDDGNEYKNDQQCNDSDYEFESDTNKRNYNQIKQHLKSSSFPNYYSSGSDDENNVGPNDDDCSVRSITNDAFGLGTAGACDVDMRIIPVQQPTSSFPDNHLHRPPKEKRSRWGDQVNEQQPSTGHQSTVRSNCARQPPSARLTAVTRNDPALLQYARANYGSVQLTEEEWTKCEDHYKVNLLYQDLLKKRNDIDKLANSGRFKYEYDSDEDVDGGTWEHKLRNAEMEATAVWSDALTKQAEGKHHIGDFLPPEELKKFMEKYDSQSTNREPDLSDYREYKLKEDNKGWFFIYNLTFTYKCSSNVSIFCSLGFQMLQKLGWKEGQGLGSDGAGIVDPVNKYVLFLCHPFKLEIAHLHVQYFLL